MKKEWLEQQLTSDDWRRLFEAVGFELSGQPNEDGWIGGVRGPSALGEGEKPNFSVNVEHGGVKDFGGSGYSGDLWDAVQKVRMCSFREALAWAAEELGIEDPKAQRRREALERFRKAPWKHGRITDVYTYRDEEGQELYQVVRYHPKADYPLPPKEKTFRQRHYNPAEAKRGDYVYSIKGVRRVLYRLPELLEAVEEGRRIWIPEGEKDVETLRDLGLAATTNVMGAGKWRDEYAGPLEGADVVVLPDNHSTGFEHAEAVARSLHGRAASVRILRLPGVGYKEDVTNWVERGGTAEELEELADQVEPFEPSPGTESGPERRGGQYFASGGQTYHITEKGRRKLVADFVAQNVAEITKEDGTRVYEIAGETRLGRRFRFDIAATDFESTRELKAAIGQAAGAQASIYAGMSRHVGPAIKQLSNGVEERRRYERTGWSEHGFLIPGRSFEGVEIDLSDTLAYGLAPDAELEKGQEALAALLEAMDARLTMPLLVFVLTGPVAALLPRVKRYAFFVKGRTNSLKTSYVQAMMAVWGPRFLEDTMLIKYGQGMTLNAAIKVAASATDMPIFFDNYKPNTGRGGDWFVNLIHNIVEGGEKLRLTANAELRSRNDLHCWPVSTGEDVPDTDPASLARQLVVEFKWRGGWNEPLGRAQQAGRHLSAIGRAWVEWLERPETKALVRELGEAYAERRKSWNQFLMECRPDMATMPRIADNLATNSMVAEIAMQCPALRPVLEERFDAYAEGLKTIGREMGDYTSSSLEGWRFIEALRALYAGGRISMTERLGAREVGDERTHVGWFDDEGFYLIPELAVSAVQELAGKDALSSITKRTLFEQLKDMGYVAKTGYQRITRKVRVGTGKRRRVLHLTKGALDEEGSATKADDNEPF